MREELFIKFLTEDSNIDSKVKVVNSRLSKARRFEDRLRVNLDEIVKDDIKMYDVLKQIQTEFGDSNGAIQNAVRKYYIFVNQTKFPTLSYFEKRLKKRGYDIWFGQTSIFQIDCALFTDRAACTS